MSWPCPICGVEHGECRPCNPATLAKIDKANERATLDTVVEDEELTEAERIEQGLEIADRWGK